MRNWGLINTESPRPSSERQCLTGTATGQPTPLTLKTLILPSLSEHCQVTAKVQNIIAFSDEVTSWVPANSLTNTLCVCSRKTASNTVIKITPETERDAQPTSSNANAIVEGMSTSALTASSRRQALNPADSFTLSAAGQCQPVGLQACGQVLSSCQLAMTVNTVSLRSSAMGSSGHPKEDRQMTAFSSNIPQETEGTERKWSDQNRTVLNDTLCSTKIC